jgi:hypothetical protein
LDYTGEYYKDFEFDNFERAYFWLNAFTNRIDTAFYRYHHTIRIVRFDRLGTLHKYEETTVLQTIPLLPVQK